MPPEVWEQVKKHLVFVEKRNAELEQLADLRCDECLREDMMRSLLASAMLRRADARAGTLKFKVNYEWNTWERPPSDCGGCWDNIYDGEPAPLTKDTREHIKTLLQPYGLCMPGDRYPQVEAEQDHNYDYSSSHAVANISPAIFNLPSDIHLRFASFVKTYGLEVIDRTTVEILPSHPPPPRTEAQDDKPTTSKGDRAASARGKEKEKKATKELKFGPVEPRWMLWSIGDPCT
ncbi:hypothetical protein BCR35DRAFT_335806 [Leucosporidium creatinivorum]|uniref:Uncharacterized protein n=1 Tax=Leucosporidium creatinivorum TaxID=106004 RepID=A0A1Y2D4Z7_9BASI|nr:hypothetical protein BCR35DRAFT_335806 [Leucosporidium creatinivorum]